MKDYGIFGEGLSGYLLYMEAFDENFPEENCEPKKPTLNSDLHSDYDDESAVDDWPDDDWADDSEDDDGWDDDGDKDSGSVIERIAALATSDCYECTSSGPDGFVFTPVDPEIVRAKRAAEQKKLAAEQEKLRIAQAAEQERIAAEQEKLRAKKAAEEAEFHAECVAECAAEKAKQEEDHRAITMVSMLLTGSLTLALTVGSVLGGVSELTIMLFAGLSGVSWFRFVRAAIRYKKKPSA